MTSTRLFQSLAMCPPEPRVVTIGTFDGVHRGHQALISAAVARARYLGIAATAVTFEPVPAAVLRPEHFPGRICTVDQKMRLISGQGLDHIISITFDRSLAQQTPEEFMTAVAKIGLSELWVGEGFALGKDRAGGIERLREIGAELGFAVNVLERKTDGGDLISSSEIRRSILRGDVSRAYRSLGRPFQIGGEVIHGAHLGRTIGYPTANVAPPRDLVPLADGIYASLTALPISSAALPSMTYVGTRPTVNAGERLIETHIFDFDGDLYGQSIEVDVLQRLRGDEVFSGLDALIAQLRSDEAVARAYLAKAMVGSPMN